MPAWLKAILVVLAAGVGLLLLIQLVPVNRTNPTVVTQVKWDSTQTQALFQRACADCHSNETTWPWYAQIAPVSWLVAHDVSEGRQRFDISNLTALDSNRLSRLGDEIQRAVVDRGEMPPSIYLPMHPSAALSAAEAQALADGLTKTLAASR